MTPEEDQIRALLREVHRNDERSAPFHVFLSAGPGPAPRVFRALILVTIVAAGSAVALLWPRRPSPPPARDAFVWSSNDRQGPLDFLLQLPSPQPLEAMPFLRVYRPGPESTKVKRREQ